MIPCKTKENNEDQFEVVVTDNRMHWKNSTTKQLVDYLFAASVGVATGWGERWTGVDGWASGVSLWGGDWGWGRVQSWTGGVSSDWAGLDWGWGEDWSWGLLWGNGVSSLWGTSDWAWTVRWGWASEATAATSANSGVRSSTSAWGWWWWWGWETATASTSAWGWWWWGWGATATASWGWWSAEIGRLVQ